MSSSPSGGIKGFFQKAAKSFKSGGIFAKDTVTWLGTKGARIGFIVATTVMVTFMPLMFEIAREGQVRILCDMCVFSLSRARVKRLVIEEITSTDSTLLC